MYDNIALLRFHDGDSGEKLVSAMISAEGEVMEFRKIVRAEGRVEDWMTAVLNEMRRTNRLITKEAIFRYCEDKSRRGPGGPGEGQMGCRKPSRPSPRPLPRASSRSGRWEVAYGPACTTPRVPRWAPWSWQRWPLSASLHIH